MIMAHRVIFTLTHGSWPPEQIDHKNGRKRGNGIANLRPATHAQNQHNQKTHRDNTSGYPGFHGTSRAASG
jgi:hypothetical protein